MCFDVDACRVTANVSDFTPISRLINIKDIIYYDRSIAFINSSAPGYAVTSHERSNSGRSRARIHTSYYDEVLAFEY